MLKRNHLWALLGATAMTTIVAQPASAQSIDDLKAQLAALAKRIEELEAKQAASEKSETKRPKISKDEPAFALATDDGLFEINVRGRVFVDSAWASDGDDTMDLKGTELRAARIGVQGKAWKDVKYVLEADFAGNEVAVADALVEYSTKYGSWRVGHFKPAISLEEMTSSVNATFTERSAFTDAFSFGRNVGIAYLNGDDNWTLFLGAFRGNNEDSLENEGYTLSARATYGQEFEGGKWIAGASLRYRDAGDGSYRYRQRAHSHLADRFVDTGTLTDRDTTYVVEAGLQLGAFHVASEYSELRAKDAAADGGSAKLWGGYIEAGWFITGEEKTLNLKKGVWDRPKVTNPVHKGGMGAWQVAARFDRLDMTDGGVYGGEQDTYLVGLNWYLNRHTRVMANYAHMTFDKAFNVAANGPDGENDADALTLRFQIDW
ncbi:OprO/OprP family phosphate-selective porin [Kordiimonas gwangyangensis]|uniref:OprO/OprP family phosphate-selective porin n=1 Tax=Kordiimonas gwangyangensis TaxID=288022 RepID=UPI000363E9C0|nr:porin [Kordiimonas gwangyangensis]